MPEANEVLECPRIRFKEVPSKLLSTRLGKFLTTFLFLVVHRNLSSSPNFSSIRLLKFLTTFFSHLPTLVTFPHKLSQLTKILSLDAPSLYHAPVTTFFSSFLVIYLHFLRKLAPSMPQRWMTGAVAPPSARHCLGYIDAPKMWCAWHSFVGLHRNRYQ